MKLFHYTFIFGLLTGASLIADSFVYVPNYFTNNVSIVNTDSNTTVATIELEAGDGPYSIAFNPGGTKSYITCSDSGLLKIIETETNTVTNTVTIGAYPIGVVVSPNGEHVYVSFQDTPGLVIIDATTETIINTTTVGSGAGLLALSPDGEKLYVPCYNDNIVNVVETSGFSVVATVPVASPFAVALTSDGEEAWTTSFDNSEIHVIETTGYTVIATISSEGYSRGIAISFGENSIAYIADNENSKVVMVDVATKTPTGPAISLSTVPNGVILSADGTRLYVTGWDDIFGTLLVFDLTDNSLIASPGVGDNPYFPAFLGGSSPPSSSKQHAFKRPNNRR